MCGGGGLGGIGKVINKVTSFHDKIDPFGKMIRDPIEDALGVPRSGEIGTALFGGEAQAADSAMTPTQLTEATNVADSVQAARDGEKRRRAAAAGLSSTILGGSGTATTSTKTLLGQ